MKKLKQIKIGSILLHTSIKFSNFLRTLKEVILT